MLVLSRKRNETIVATVPASTEPTTITFTILHIKGGGKSAITRVGIKANERVRVIRAELDPTVELPDLQRYQQED